MLPRLARSRCYAILLAGTWVISGPAQTSGLGQTWCAWVAWSQFPLIRALRSTSAIGASGNGGSPQNLGRLLVSLSCSQPWNLQRPQTHRGRHSALAILRRRDAAVRAPAWLGQPRKLAGRKRLVPLDSRIPPGRSWLAISRCGAGARATSSEC